MSHLEISTHKVGGASVATWRINRRERGNALGTTLAQELQAALGDLMCRPSPPRAIVLTASPVVKGVQRTWIAGGDLKELATLGSQDDGEAYALALSTFLSGLDELPIPVVMAIDGDAIGGGAELALGGDVRLATSSSRLVFKQLAVGLATGYGGARRLVELVGLARAQDLIYGTRTIDAAEALGMGLVNEVWPDAAALQTAVDARLATLLAIEPRAFATQKRMFWHATRSHPGTSREVETRLFRELWGNPTHRRFLTAFVGKEPDR